LKHGIDGGGEAGAGQFLLMGWELTVSDDVRAPLAPVTLMGALGSVGDRQPKASQHACTQRPSIGVAVRHLVSARVGEVAKEALREMREVAAWLAWVEEGGYGGGVGLCCC
jgi:hypothetical protein